MKLVGIQENTRPPISQRGTVCVGSLKAPSPSRSLVVIINTSTTFIHPREFLFVSSYGFVSRPVPALTDDTVDPFAGGLQEGRAR